MTTPLSQSAPAPPSPQPGASRRVRARRWLRQDLPRWLERTFFEPPLAPVAIEVDGSQLILAVTRREPQAARPQVTLLRARALPEGLVRPSILQPNVSDAAALGAEVRRLFAGLDAPRAVSVLVPDGAAKIGLLDMEALPASRKDALELLRFRLKKTVPFRIEDAIVEFQVVGAAAGRVRLLTAVANRAVLEPYEAAVEEALGAQAGLVTLPTLALVERCLVPGSAAQAEGDVLLVNLTPHALTMAVSRGSELLMFRCKALPSPQEATGDERRQAARREWQATVAYYQEKLSGRGFARALARLVGWRPDELLGPQELGRLEGIDASRWADPVQGLEAPPGDGALFAPALALALKGSA